MNGPGRAGEVAREALTTARTQPVTSIVTVVLVGLMCATVLLTTGRTVAAERGVLGSIDSAGTRSIVVRADSAKAGISSGVLDRLAHVQGIAWVAAFGPAIDTENAAFPGGARVPVREAWGVDLSSLGVPGANPFGGNAVWADDSALDQLGMPDDAGAVVDDDGTDRAVAGRLTVPDYLAFLTPLALAPQPADRPGSVSVIVVVAQRPDLVAPVSRAVESVLAPQDASAVKIATSANLATLRGLVQGQLGAYGRGLVVIVFILTAALVAAILYGLVLMRRKDFGRRRALGASRALIVALLLTQTTVVAIVGAVVGCAGAVVALGVEGDRLPGIAFTCALGVLAVAVAAVASIVPAISAARRDPVKELRVP